MLSRKRKTLKRTKLLRNCRKFLIKLFSKLIYFAGIAAAIFVLTLSLIQTSETNVKGFNKFTSVTVISGSMDPTLKVYDVLLVAPKEGDYQVGDIITFWGPDEGNKYKTYTHRIISAGDGFYFTKGDANNEMDHWTIYNEQVIGKVILKLPKLGKIMLKLSQIPVKTLINILTSIISLIWVDMFLGYISDVLKDLTPEELRLIEINKHTKFNLKMKKVVWQLQLRDKLNKWLIK